MLTVSLVVPRRHAPSTKQCYWLVGNVSNVNYPYRDETTVWRIIWVRSVSNVNCLCRGASSARSEQKTVLLVGNVYPMLTIRICVLWCFVSTLQVAGQCYWLVACVSNVDYPYRGASSARSELLDSVIGLWSACLC